MVFAKWFFPWRKQFFGFFIREITLLFGVCKNLAKEGRGGVEVQGEYQIGE